MKTLGTSPKVAAFIAATSLPGVILLVLGAILDIAELRSAGLALLGGSVLGGGAGYSAPPGDVVDTAPHQELVDPGAGDVRPPA